MTGDAGGRTDMIEDQAPIVVLGLGGAGCRFVRALAAMSPKHLRLVAVDTDRSELERCPVPAADRLLAAAGWREGRGCGGSVMDGQRALSRERPALESLLAGAPLLLVLGGLGGGTASGGAAILSSVCRKLNVPALFLLTFPFSLEGHSRRRIAEEALNNELLETADAVLTLPNDLLFSVLPGGAPLTEAFAASDREVAGTALALTEVLKQGTLLAVNFADLVAVLRRRKSLCSVGVGTASTGEGADGTGRCQLALERMLQSPLLGGTDKIADADAVIISLIGDVSLALGETRQVLEQAGTFVRPDAQLLAGASVAKGFENRVQICSIAVKFDSMQERDGGVFAHGRPDRKHEEVEQLRLELDTVSKGTMENTTPVVLDGEDLDVPSFRRRKVAIDAGKTVSAAEARR